jgi:hypothetical protein
MVAAHSRQGGSVWSEIRTGRAGRGAHIADKRLVVVDPPRQTVACRPQFVYPGSRSTHRSWPTLRTKCVGRSVPRAEPAPDATGRENTGGRATFAVGVLLPSPVTFGGAFDGRGQPYRPAPPAATTRAAYTRIAKEGVIPCSHTGGIITRSQRQTFLISSLLTTATTKTRTKERKNSTRRTRRKQKNRSGLPRWDRNRQAESRFPRLRLPPPTHRPGAGGRREGSLARRSRRRRRSGRRSVTVFPRTYTAPFGYLSLPGDDNRTRVRDLA